MKILSFTLIAILWCGWFVSNACAESPITGDLGVFVGHENASINNCQGACNADIDVDINNRQGVNFSTYYNLGLIKVGGNFQYFDGVGYALALKKEFSRFALSAGAGQHKKKGEVNFGAFNPFDQEIDNNGRLYYLRVDYSPKPVYSVWLKYDYLSADHSATAHEFLGFDVDGNKVFGPQTQSIDFDSVSKRILFGLSVNY